MQELKKHIPNGLTSLNLLLGCFAIVQALNGSLYTAAYLIAGAAILDFFDGFIARLLHAQSEIGKQLDSLADVVSFGVAPGFIFYQFAGSCMQQDSFCITPYFSFLIPVFSAIRLAKFNIDTRQTEGFIGLPTPANALFFASIPFVADTYLNLQPIMQTHVFLRALPLLSSYLLTSEIRMLALKFKSFGIKENLTRYIVILVGLAAVIIFRQSGVALAIMLYILLSIITHLITHKSTTT